MLKQKTLTIVASTALAACLSFGSTLPASASGNDIMYHQRNNSIIMPRYEVIQSMSASIEISSSGYATCTGHADVRSGYTCDATLELQQKSGTSWKTIKKWTSSGRTNSFDKGLYVTSGHNYRLKLSADVYASSGSWVEKPITYSETVNY